MRKILTLLLLCTLFAACGDDDDPVPEVVGLKLSKSAVTLDTDNYYTIIDIESGKGEYKVTSSDEKVAMAVVDNATKKVYIIGLGMGKSTIEVTDVDGLKGSVAVNIETLISQPIAPMQTLFVKTGETKSLDFPQEVNDNFFAISENEAIATIALNTSTKKVEIKGVSQGFTHLYVNELIWTRFGYGVNVVNMYPLLLPNHQIDVPVGSDDAYFHIVYGNGGYEFISDDPTIAEVEEVLPYAGDVVGASNAQTIKVKALKAGVAVITVIDAEDLKTTVEVIVRG